MKDGYVDINVVVPGMGYHFMNPALVDGTFDIRKPEILVYNIDEDGLGVFSPVNPDVILL